MVIFLLHYKYKVLLFYFLLVLLLSYFFRRQHCLKLSASGATNYSSTCSRCVHHIMWCATSHPPALLDCVIISRRHQNDGRLLHLASVGTCRLVRALSATLSTPSLW